MFLAEPVARLYSPASPEIPSMDLQQ